MRKKISGQLRQNFLRKKENFFRKNATPLDKGPNDYVIIQVMFNSGYMNNGFSAVVWELTLSLEWKPLWQHGMFLKVQTECC